MKTDEKNAALVPVQSSAISHTGAASLACRGLSELRASEEGYFAQWTKGRALLKENRFQEAIAYFEHASQLNPEQADNQWRFTFLLDEWHVGPPRNDIESVRWYRSGAERGIVFAQLRLANAYFRGNGIAQDYVQAAFWYRKAAEQGDKLAAQMLTESCMTECNSNKETSD